MFKEILSPAGTVVVAAVIGVGIGYSVGKPSGVAEKAERAEEQPRPRYDFTKGLLAHYPFNNGASDVTGNANDGKIKSVAGTEGRRSNDDGAYEFTGVRGSHISIPESDTLRPQKMTLNAWVYLSQVGADETFIILAKEESIHLVIDNTGKSGAKNFFGLNTGGWGKWENLEYKGRVPVGEWFMYTATYDGDTMKQYLNSQEICSGRFTGAVPYENSHNYPFRIGAGKLSRGDLANKLDDLRIYNRALPAEEIKALYEMEKP